MRRTSRVPRRAPKPSRRYRRRARRSVATARAARCDRTSTCARRTPALLGLARVARAAARSARTGRAPSSRRDTSTTSSSTPGCNGSPTSSCSAAQLAAPRARHADRALRRLRRRREPGGFGDLVRPARLPHGRRRRRAARPLALKGQDWGIPPQDPQALAQRRVRAVPRADRRQHAALRRAAHRPRHGAVPPVVGAARLRLDRRRIRPLPARRPDVGARARERAPPMPRRRRGPRHGARRVRARDARATPSITTRCCCSRRTKTAGSAPRSTSSDARSPRVTTHDLPTLRGYWEGRDLAMRDALDLFPSDEIRGSSCTRNARTTAPRCSRRSMAPALAPRDATQRGDQPFSDALARAIQLYLAQLGVRARRACRSRT